MWLWPCRPIEGGTSQRPNTTVGHGTGWRHVRWTYAFQKLASRGQEAVKTKKEKRLIIFLPLGLSLSCIHRTIGKNVGFEDARLGWRRERRVLSNLMPTIGAEDVASHWVSY